MEQKPSLRRVIGEYAVSFLPKPVRRRIVGPHYSWSFKEMLPLAKPGEGEVKLLIAPANSASQGYYWARAAETLPGVSARNLAFGYRPVGASIAPDFAVAGTVGRYSRAWAMRQRQVILDQFTHVIYEAERPILGSLYGEDVLAEVQDLQSHGIKVAMLSHGSDIRTPSEHVAIEPYSPFREPLDGLTEALEKGTARRRSLLAALDVPKFVSTPDLLRYLPEASWLPTLTDPARWTAVPPSRLGEDKLRVLHIPSSSALKGTVHIQSAMRELEREGLIQYTELQGIPYLEMPGKIAHADVVIDQVSMGLYGIASVEAMFAGRLVVAQVGDFIREEIKDRTGWDVPILEANPDTIKRVVADVAADPGAYADQITQGRQYALDVHSQARVANTLRPFLGR